LKADSLLLRWQKLLEYPSAPLGGEWLTIYGLSIAAEYTPFTDAELDRLVQDVQRDFPMCGNRQMQGHLMSPWLSSSTTKYLRSPVES